MSPLRRAAGVTPSDWWEYAPGDRVMTREGIAGIVTEVSDGPTADSASYIVKLDHGMGGGEYDSRELSAVEGDRTARTAATEFHNRDRVSGPLGEGVVEFGNTDTGLQVRWDYGGVTAIDDSVTMVAPGADRWTCENCGWGNTDSPVCGSCGENRTSRTAGRWHDEHPGEGDDPGYDDEYVSFEDQRGAPADEEGHHVASDDYPELAEILVERPPLPHVASKFYVLDSVGNPVSGPYNNSAEAEQDMVAGGSIYVDTDEQTYEGWATEDANTLSDLGNVMTDYPGSVTAPDVYNASKTAGFGDVVHDVIPSKYRFNPNGNWSYDWCRFRKNERCFYPREMDAEATKEAGYVVWKPYDRGICPRGSWDAQKACPVGEPGPHSGESNAMVDATIPYEEGGQHGGVPITRSPYSASVDHSQTWVHEPGIGWNTPVSGASLSNMDGLMCPGCRGSGIGGPFALPQDHLACGKCSGTGNVDARKLAQIIQELEPDLSDLSIVSLRDPIALDLLATASTDPSFAFHVTASWADVRKKAKRIKDEGGVRIIASTGTDITAEVHGDHGVYETRLTRPPGGKAVAMWECGCKWASYSWDRSGPWKRYEGRMCSHALALNYEAAAQEWMGGTVQEQPNAPEWSRGVKPHAWEPQKPPAFLTGPPRRAARRVAVESDLGPSLASQVVSYAGQGPMGKVRGRIVQLLALQPGHKVRVQGDEVVSAEEVLHPKWDPHEGLSYWGPGNTQASKTAVTAMRVPGYCQHCRRIRTVTTPYPSPGVSVGICDECQDERDGKKTSSKTAGAADDFVTGKPIAWMGHDHVYQDGVLESVNDSGFTADGEHHSWSEVQMAHQDKGKKEAAELNLGDAVQSTGNPPVVSTLVRQYAIAPIDTDFYADEADDLSAAYRKLAVVDPKVVPVWERLGAIVRDQAQALSQTFDIQVLASDPYETAEQMHADIDQGVYKVTTLHSAHPVWDTDTNVAFRISHDILGHGAAHSDFSLKGEIMAFQAECEHTPVDLWPALFTEIVAQASYANTHHLFGEQKVGLIDLTPEQIQQHVGKVMDAPDPAWDRLHYSASKTAQDIDTLDGPFGDPYGTHVRFYVNHDDDPADFVDPLATDWEGGASNPEVNIHRPPEPALPVAESEEKTATRGHVLKTISTDLGTKASCSCGQVFKPFDDSDTEYFPTNTPGLGRWIQRLYDEHLSGDKTASKTAYLPEYLDGVRPGDVLDGGKVKAVYVTDYVLTGESILDDPDRQVGHPAYNEDDGLEKRYWGVIAFADGTSSGHIPFRGTPDPEIPRFAAKTAALDSRAWLLNGSSKGDDVSIAESARAFLAKTGAKKFSPLEQQELINEGVGTIAGNFDRLDIKGTHYEMLDDNEDVLWL